MALRATVYLALLGKNGLRQVALMSCRRAQYAAQQLQQAGLELMFDGPYFREFAVRCPDPSAVQQQAAAQGYAIGPQLQQFEIPGLGNDASHGMLWAFTEKHSTAAIDGLITALRT